jgi:hypothetical protein
VGCTFGGLAWFSVVSWLILINYLCNLGYGNSSTCSK